MNDDKDSVAFWYEKARLLEEDVDEYRNLLKLCAVGYLVIIIVWLLA